MCTDWLLNFILFGLLFPLGIAVWVSIIMLIKTVIKNWKDV